MGGNTGPNSYSAAWFEFFHVGISAARTAQETAFVQESCPLPAFARLLDVCCGMDRHARALAGLGYTVTGIERDAQAAAVWARARGRPAEMARFAESAGFRLTTACTDFDASVAPSTDKPRIQLSVLKAS